MKIMKTDVIQIPSEVDRVGKWWLFPVAKREDIEDMPVFAFVSKCPSKWARMHVLKVKTDDDNVPMLPRDAR